MARKRQPKTLLEWNVLFAAGSLMSEKQRATGKRLPLMEQARLMIKAMPKATRVGEFVAMWTIVKYQEGAASVERLAEYWDEPVRTVYRRLEEFRGCWGPAGHDTPDQIADSLIADYKRRNEQITARCVGKLLTAPVAVPVTSTPAGVTI